MNLTKYDMAFMFYNGASVHGGSIRLNGDGISVSFIVEAQRLKRKCLKICTIDILIKLFYLSYVIVFT